jgi:hypothetical protein
MKRKNISIILLMIFMSATYMSCSKLSSVNGNGHVLQEERRLVNFNQVVNEGEFNVIIIHDTIYQAVVEAETNLIPYIRTLVNGNTLIIDSREILHPGMPITIYVSTPEIKYVEMSGSGTIYCDSIFGNNVGAKLSGSGSIEAKLFGSASELVISGSGNMILNVESQMNFTTISGSGDIYIDGNTNEGEFKISGSGNINSYEFHQQNLDANISGSGNMYVNVSDFLKARISGSGSIYYLGDPGLDVSITGSGSVIKQ